MPKTKQECRIKGCTGKVHTRGVCFRCYRAAYRLVEREQTTWDELESMGLLATTKRSPNSPTVPLTIVFRAMKLRKAN